jgi:single-strand DNA-binding protein
MPYMNEIQVMGHAGRDPEFKTTANGKEMCKFSIAVSQGRDKPTDWFNVTCFGNQAVWAQEQVKKGGLTMAIGRMTSREYEGKTYWEVIANRVLTFEKRDAQVVQQVPGSEVIFNESDVPF